MSHDSFPKDTVMLHQTGRAKHSPALSPFAMKLETYLRMADIPYKSVHGKKKSPKGKIPWIEYNSETVSDSTFVIEYLNKKRDVDLSKDLTAEEKAVGKAFQRMVEENLYWTLVYARWVDKDLSTSLRDNLPRGFMMDILLWRNKGQVQKTLHSHGIGRHSREEIYQIAENDIRALSGYLGDKQFFFGENGNEVDASIFGLMATFAYELPDSPQEKLIKGDCKNLFEYCERMKEKYWPDWDQCTMGDVAISNFPAVPDTDPTVWKPEGAKSKAAKAEKSEPGEAANGDAKPADGVVNGDAAENAEAEGEKPADDKVEEAKEVAEKPEESKAAEEAPKETEEVAEAKENIEEQKAQDPPAEVQEPAKEEEENKETKEDSGNVNADEKPQEGTKPQENGDAQPEDKVEQEEAK